MKPLNPKLVEDAVFVRREMVKQDPRSLWSVTHNPDFFKEQLNKTPIFELEHCCESSPEECAILSLLDSDNPSSKTLWEGHWRGERVRFLAPRCWGNTGGWGLSGAYVAAVIASETGEEAIAERELYPIIYSYALCRNG